MIRASSFNRALRLTSAAIALGFAALAVPTPSFAQATTETARKSFNVPADNAEAALKRFSEQSGQEVLFPTDVVRGVSFLGGRRGWNFRGRGWPRPCRN